MKRTIAAAAAVSASVLLALNPTTAQATGTDHDVRATTAGHDAHTGVRTAALGTGHGISVGTVPLTTDLSLGKYFLKDPTRGNTRTIDADTRQVLTDTDNVWGDDYPSSYQADGVDARLPIRTLDRRPYRRCPPAVDRRRAAAGSRRGAL